MKANVGGKFFNSWKAAAAAHGISYETYISRVHNQGWDRARAATEPLKRAATYILNDVPMGTADIAQIAGLKTNTVWRRMRRGASPAEAAQPRKRRIFEDAATRRAADRIHEIRRKKKHQNAIAQYKLSKQCHDCTGVFTASQLEYDHCRGKKKFALSAGAKYSLRRIAAEIAKCDVVCANCHRLRTHKRKSA
jgi:hypothetical protein